MPPPNEAVDWAVRKAGKNSMAYSRCPRRIPDPLAFLSTRPKRNCIVQKLSSVAPPFMPMPAPVSQPNSVAPSPMGDSRRSPDGSDCAGEMLESGSVERGMVRSGGVRVGDSAAAGEACNSIHTASAKAFASRTLLTSKLYNIFAPVPVVFCRIERPDCIMGIRLRKLARELSQIASQFPTPSQVLSGSKESIAQRSCRKSDFPAISPDRELFYSGVVRR